MKESEMFKARIQLGLIALVLGIAGFWLLGSTAGETMPSLQKVVFLFFDGTFLVSAIGILACTFIGAKQIADGSVCFMPDNPLVKLRLVDKKGTNICPTFWFVGLVITFVATVVFVSLMFIFEVLPDLIHTISTNDVRIEGGYSLLLFVSAVAGIIALILLLLWLLENGFWIGTVLLTVIGISAIITMLYILPTLTIIRSYNLSENLGGWMTATVIYLKWAGIIVTGIASAAGVIYLAFRNWTALQNSWLGRQITLLKKNLCVRFIECPGQVSQTNEA